MPGPVVVKDLEVEAGTFHHVTVNQDPDLVFVHPVSGTRRVARFTGQDRRGCLASEGPRVSKRLGMPIRVAGDPLLYNGEHP